MRPSLRRLLLLAFWSAAFSSAPWTFATAAPRSKSAGNLYLLTVTVGTHAENGTPDDWNYTAVELERIVKDQCGPLFHEVKSNLVKGSQATPEGVMQGFGGWKKTSRSRTWP